MSWLSDKINPKAPPPPGPPPLALYFAGAAIGGFMLTFLIFKLAR